MTILHSIILGIIEGITEFLPISSTGHLILSAKLLQIAESNFTKSFEIIIQLGAILAVLVLYWKKLLMNWEIFKRVVVAFIPTGVIGLAIYKIIKTYLLGSETVVLWSLLLGGLILIIFEKYYHEKKTPVDDMMNITYKQALALGLFQSIAIIPGISRSAATIIGGLLLGLKRKTIVEFSFLLAIPTMVAATGLDLIKNSDSFSSSEFDTLAVGFIVSFVVAIVAVKWLLKYIQNHTFTLFGYYRIIIAILFFIFLI
jgi:undecaprenyl-diphosphatase